MLQTAAGISDITNGLNRGPSILALRAEAMTADSGRQSVSLRIAGEAKSPPAEDVIVDLHEAAANAVAGEIRSKLEDMAMEILRLDVEMLLTMLGQGPEQAEEAAARATTAIESLFARHDEEHGAELGAESGVTVVSATLTIRSLEISIDGETGAVTVNVTEINQSVSGAVASAALGGVSLDGSLGAAIHHAAESQSIHFDQTGPGVAEAAAGFAAADLTNQSADPDRSRLILRAVERAPDGAGMTARMDAAITTELDTPPSHRAPPRPAAGDLISVQA